MRLPDDSQHLAIYGMNGSGKTIAALWHLSNRSYTLRPWMIFDFKGDENIGRIPYSREVKIGEVPKHPGVYIVRPVPGVDDDGVEKTMWTIWERGNTGVWIDEGYMVGSRNNAYNALLTQGRSKSIPVITLSQRPKWLSRFVISEAAFHQVFFLSDESDREAVQRFIPYNISETRLPKFHSWYYDVGEDEFTGLEPVPEPEATFEKFESRLRKTPRFI